jgi:hypothetical protein
MPDEPFQMLSHDDQREALQVAAGCSGRPAYLLEKDIWGVQICICAHAHECTCVKLMPDTGKRLLITTGRPPDGRLPTEDMSTTRLDGLGHAFDRTPANAGIPNRGWR